MTDITKFDTSALNRIDGVAPRYQCTPDRWT